MTGKSQWFWLNGDFCVASRIGLFRQLHIQCGAVIPGTCETPMNLVSALFSVAYLINLPERVDRLESAKVQLASVGWDIGPGGVRLFPALRFDNQAGFPNAGIRGCYESHLECLRRALAGGCKSVLVLEDDIALSPSLPRLTPAIVSQLYARDWDFVYFGHYGTGEVPLALRDTDEYNLRLDDHTGGVLSTHFYGVNARIMPRLIKHLEDLANGPAGDQEAGPMPIDGAYNIFRRNNSGIRCVIASPMLGWQTSSRSDITPHAMDRLTFLRPAVAAMRILKRRVARSSS
jgi:GR25 family glycosyltransferase involved in LPS biosynthesis